MHYDARPLRIEELDAVRGFALCGILVVDIWRITDMPATDGSGAVFPVRHVLSVLFEGRFFPIFSFLFGIGFALLLDGAAQRSERPRLVLVRRLLALGLIGLVHQQFQPGEALLPYALAGLVILLPASALPTWAVFLAGLVGTFGVALALGGGLALAPGLFLLGLATVRAGVVDTLEERGWQIGVVFALALPAAIAAGRWEYRTPYLELWSTPAMAVAGLLGALAYVTGLLLLLRIEPGQVLAEVLRPLGRMALTNYVGATALILSAAPRLGLPGSDDYATVLGLAVAIIAVQAVFSAVWLRLFEYGPLEWWWRCVTWWTVVPIRRVRVPSRRY
ncbi:MULTISPECIES: DUF418 domain-containing protein [Nocardia]|uniref:DUF418 domain-containing protein n=1 Tax=Nocardia sputorum TaxID=2984338 RepID=A0ABM8D442_9NOCA|nr:DUF418 domain-containing protein [Nocardia sputorum]BDT94660.1 hypothetical protein IFM12275_46360 [Nocardia sputorum]BDU02092.1 hypothetical protein IFM12276_51200 [Nocardia sputorum]